MNRKLHHTLTALSATGLVLVVGLMTARPADPAHRAFGQEVVGTVSHAPSRQDAGAWRHADARAKAIEARARAFEAEYLQAADAGEAIATTAAFVAETATEAALAAAFASLATSFDADAGADADEADDEPARRQAPRRRASRSKLALPYFSFAHGLRRNGN